MNSPHSILKNVPSLLANKEISINIWRQYRENVPFDVVIQMHQTNINRPAIRFEMKNIRKTGSPVYFPKYDLKNIGDKLLTSNA